MMAVSCACGWVFGPRICSSMAILRIGLPLVGGAPSTGSWRMGIGVILALASASDAARGGHDRAVTWHPASLRQGGSSRRCDRREGIGHQMYRSEEHTSELQSLMRTSYAGSCLNTKNN